MTTPGDPFNEGSSHIGAGYPMVLPAVPNLPTLFGKDQGATESENEANENDKEPRKAPQGVELVDPRAGWRGTVVDLTRGAWKPGPNPKDVLRERRELARELRTFRKTKPIIAIENTKSSGKTTLSSWLTAVLQHYIGLPWLLVDCNENAGGTARRNGIDTTDLMCLRALIQYIKDGHPFNMEFALEHFESHWQPSLSGEFGEGFLVVPSDQKPDLTIQLRVDDIIRMLMKIKRSVFGIMADTGNGLTWATNAGAFIAANRTLYAGQADNEESLTDLEITRTTYAEIDPEKVDNSLIVIGAALPTDSPEHYASVFKVDPKTVFLIPYDPYLKNGRDSVDHNVVRLDLVPPEVINALMRIGVATLENLIPDEQLPYRQKVMEDPLHNLLVVPFAGQSNGGFTPSVPIQQAIMPEGS